MTTRRAFLCVLALTAGARSMAAPPSAHRPRLAALSLVGDRLLIVGSRMAAGGTPDPNRKDWLLLASDDLDVATARELERQAKAVVPGLEVTSVRSRDPAVRNLHEDVVAGDRGLREVVERLRPMLLSQGFTHLLLLTRHRGEGRIRTADGTIGIGRVEGLGFYVDRETRLPAGEAGEPGGPGFLATFAYLRAYLVELGTFAVLGEETSLEAEAVMTVGAAESAHPWDALSADEKTAALGRFTARGLEAVVPQVLEKLPVPR